MTEIGDIIRAHRKSRGLTLVQLAELTGLDCGNLSKLENGKQNLTNDSIMSLAAAFQLTLPELFSLEENTQSPKNATISNKLQTLNISNNFRTVGSFRKLKDIPRGESVLVSGIKVVDSEAHDSNDHPKWERDDNVQFRFLGDLIRELPDSIPADLVASEIDDDTMTPRLFKSDRILIDTGDVKVPNTGGVFALISDNGPIEVRRLFPRAGNGLMIACDNGRYPPISLTEAEAKFVMIIGRVKITQSTAGL